MITAATPPLLPTVADREPVRLTGHVGLGGVPVSPVFRTVLGLPFAAAGVFVLTVAARQARGEVVAGANAPWPVMLAIGTLFAGIGSWLALGGLAELLAAQARAGRRRRFADQPWLADFAWERHGGRDRAPLELLGAFGLLGFVGIFALTFGWVGFLGGGGIPFKLAGGLLIVGTGAAAVRAGRLAGRQLHWGRSRLRFLDFPCAPGTDVEVIFDDLAPDVRRLPLRATLRCVQERWETTRASEQSTSLVHYALWSTTATIPPGGRSMRFALPADAPGTDLASRPARYWELEVVSDTPGLDYEARFLVPVYERGEG